MSQPTSMARSTALMLTILISDLMFVSPVAVLRIWIAEVISRQISRLWIVWNYNLYVLILPIFTTIGYLVASVGDLRTLKHLPDDSILTHAMESWLTAQFAFSSIVNIYCTAGIAWKVWQATHSIAHVTYRGSKLVRIVRIVIESAAAYTAYKLFYFGTYVAHSDLQYFALDMDSPVVGITFILIIVRVGLGWTDQAQPAADLLRRSTAEQTVDMPPFGINVTQVIHHTRDTSSSSKIGPELV
ncbi:hypothetical protein IEO21_01341 [Rhodonia placenta]|uniref:Uncharacterized protein n=1 Tax=Rhodonia placenta TaxID=104341 RepID=A0A8H7U6C0_9APHY|nr:hypothetical protein IEO21_01341 [Postia placenta]